LCNEILTFFLRYRENYLFFGDDYECIRKFIAQEPNTINQLVDYHFCLLTKSLGSVVSAGHYPGFCPTRPKGHLAPNFNQSKIFKLGMQIQSSPNAAAADSKKFGFFRHI
jgi:hypothetical protein